MSGSFEYLRWRFEENSSKERRKLKNSRKNVDSDVSFGRDGGKSTTMNDESSKTINSRCQYSG
jgi:hypothetical protein